MKRTLTIALLVCALALLLCVAAYAADAPAADGIYELKKETPAGLTVDVTPCKDKETNVAPETTASIGGTDQAFYAEAESMIVTVKGVTVGTQQLILVLDEDAKPVQGIIRYIDQKAADSSEVSYFVYPDKLEKDEIYYIFIVGADGNMIKLASFRFYQSAPPYILGDVDGDGEVTSDDALMALQSVVGLIELDETQTLAADVDHDGDVTSDDALMILQFVVGLIDEEEFV